MFYVCMLRDEFVCIRQMNWWRRFLPIAKTRISTICYLIHPFFAWKRRMHFFYQRLLCICYKMLKLMVFHLFWVLVVVNVDQGLKMFNCVVRKRREMQLGDLRSWGSREGVIDDLLIYKIFFHSKIFCWSIRFWFVIIVILYGCAWVFQSLRCL